MKYRVFALLAGLLMLLSACGEKKVEMQNLTFGEESKILPATTRNEA